ncbi:hypothetical protein GCM10020216_047200 [Nonomuraea helvata]
MDGNVHNPDTCWPGEANIPDTAGSAAAVTACVQVAFASSCAALPRETLCRPALSARTRVCRPSFVACADPAASGDDSQVSGGGLFSPSAAGSSTISRGFSSGSEPLGRLLSLSVLPSAWG